MNVADALIITLLLLSALNGFKRGLLDAVGRIISLVAAFLVALCFCDDLAVPLQSRFGLNQIIAAKLQGTAFSFNQLDNPLLQLLLDLPGAQDMRLLVAQNITVILCFLLLLIIVSTLIMVLWRPLTGLFSHGITGIVNRLAGMAVNSAKSAFVILIVYLSLIPLLQGLAALDIPMAVVICAYLQDSRILIWVHNSFPKIGSFLIGSV